MTTITANELSGKSEDYTGSREYEVRERIPLPYDNYFQSILGLAPRVKVIFNIGPMASVLVAPVPMAPGGPIGMCSINN